MVELIEESGPGVLEGQVVGLRVVLRSFGVGESDGTSRGILARRTTAVMLPFSTQEETKRNE